MDEGGADSGSTDEDCDLKRMVFYNEAAASGVHNKLMKAQ